VERRRFSRADIEEMKKLASEASRRVEQIRSEGQALKLHMAEARWRRYRDLANQRKQPADPSPVKVRLQALRIGDIAFVAMPGEPFAEIGVEIKKASPFPHTLFCGYSNGEGGDYMPVESEYAFGGYEVERTPYAPTAAAALVRAASAMLRELQQRTPTQ
jgi:hypothetical protein